MNINTKSLHIFFVPLVAIVFFELAFSQQYWEKTYGGTSYDGGMSVEQTYDGGYIVAGGTTSFGAGNNDVYLIKTNANGDTLWTRTYGGVSLDAGYSVRQTSDRGYIIVGLTSYNYNVYLIKTNANGDTLWTRIYGGVGADFGMSVEQTSDGGYIVGGWTTSFGTGDTAAYLIKTDAAGDTLWTRTYWGPDPGFNVIAYSVQQTSDGGYIVAGYNYPHPLIRSNVYLIKTDAAGDTIWTRTFGEANNEDYSYSVQQTSDGGYIIVGCTTWNPNVDEDVYLIKTDANGDAIWTRTYDGSGRWNYGWSVLQTSDSGYIITGMTWPYDAGAYDVLLIKTNANGDTLWTSTYGGTGEDIGRSVQQTTDGGYIVAGWTESFGSGPRDVYLIKIRPDESSVSEQKGAMYSPRYHVMLSVTPNPFISFAAIPGHERESFALYDISGHKAGVFRGDRIGEGLPAGVYFLRLDGNDAVSKKIVKLR